VGVPSLLRAIQRTYEQQDDSEGCRVDLQSAPDVDVATDPTVARRVIENMVKNAVEATGPDGVVTLGAEEIEEAVAVRVHNPGTIPESVRYQIFQRSFSTKGRGRGLGTYSMRLLGEEYLGGEVSFTTSEREGTTFLFWIPKSWRGQGAGDDW